MIDIFDEEEEPDDNFDEPLAFCIFCEAPLFEPEELETGFCIGGVCEEHFHNTEEFE